jgi:hypothetical protein
MIEIGARQAQPAFVPIQSNPCFPAQLFATLVTLRLAIRDKDFDFLALHHGIWIIRLTGRKAKYSRRWIEGKRGHALCESRFAGEASDWADR